MLQSVQIDSPLQITLTCVFVFTICIRIHLMGAVVFFYLFIFYLFVYLIYFLFYVFLWGLGNL